jgi:hypothetical protein
MLAFSQPLHRAVNVINDAEGRSVLFGINSEADRFTSRAGLTVYEDACLIDALQSS